MGKNNHINKVIGLTEDFYSYFLNGGFYRGDYVILKRNSKGEYVPNGAPKTIRDLYPIIEGRKLRYATPNAQIHLLEASTSKKMKKYIRSLETIDLSKYFK